MAQGVAGIDISEIDLSVYVPGGSNAEFGVIGPSTKGDTNKREFFSDEGNLVVGRGRPVDRHHSIRASIRTLKRANSIQHVRVAGTLLTNALVDLYDDTGAQKILTFTAASGGSWAEQEGLSVGIIHNGTPATSYDVYVYKDGRRVDNGAYANLDNSTIAAAMANDPYVTVTVDPGAGTTFPAETVDAITELISPESLTGGNDGAFASTVSDDSSTGGMAEKRFYGMMDSVAGSRTWHNLRTILAAEAGLTTYRGTLGMPVQPGTFTIRVQDTGGPTYVELSDDEEGTLVNGMVGTGVGLLKSNAGTHVGFIDYRTGIWGVLLTGGAVGFLNGTIDAIYIRGRSESTGTTTSGVESYSGTLSSPDVCPGHFTVARVQFAVTRSDTICTDSGVAGAQHDSADANCQEMDGYIIPGTIAVTAPTATATQTVYDDGLGGWNTAAYGAGTPVVGTINYRTGAWDITFPASVPANSVITAEYDNILSDMGGNALAGNSGSYQAADVVCTNAGGGAAQIDSADANCAPMANIPVVPGSIRFVCSDVGGAPETIYDDGVGGLCTLRRGDPESVDVVGTVNYTTGAWDITWSGLVGAGATITASYVDVSGTNTIHALRANSDRLDQTDPASGNNFLGLNWVNYLTGGFAFKFSFGANEDVKNNATITATYQHGEFIGWGDGSTVAFSGTVADAPIRRGNDRMLAFQGAQQSAAAGGEAQVAHSVASTQDYWDQNVGGGAAANPINFFTGVTSMQWTGAPILMEAVFVVSEQTAAHCRSLWPGPIGNERATITDGFFAKLSAGTLTGTLKFEVLYNQYGAGSVAVETFDNVTDFAELVNKVNGLQGYTGSFYVNLDVEITGAEVDTSVDQNFGMAGAFTNADVIGAKTGATYTGMQLFANPEQVPLHFLSAPGIYHRQVQDAGVALCETSGRRAVFFHAIPDFTPPDQLADDLAGVSSTDPVQDLIDYTNGNYEAATQGGVARETVLIPYPPLAAWNSSYSFAFGLWVQYFDQYANADVWEDPVGDISLITARTDQIAYPWYPIAGERRGKFDVSAVRYSPDKGERKQMCPTTTTGTPNIINPIISIYGRGIFLYGQRTTQRTPTATDRLNVRWMLNMVENQLEAVSGEIPFELNDDVLWREVRSLMRKIISPVAINRGVYDFRVQCDDKTNTPDTIDELKVVAKLFVQPTKAAEELEYQVVITPTGVDFTELLAA